LAVDNVDNLGRGPRLTDAARKAEYKARSEFSGAVASLQRDLGALIGALVEYQPQARTVELLRGWREVVRDASNEANQELRDHRKIGAYEDAMPKGDGWVGSWPLGGGNFGRRHCTSARTTADSSATGL
jgi:hypothetical protein